MGEVLNINSSNNNNKKIILKIKHKINKNDANPASPLAILIIL
jgi:hypothetical protein